MEICHILLIELNDMQKELQQMVRKFAREEILPKAAHYDKTMEYPWEIVKRAYELGILNPHIPEDIGKHYGTVTTIYIASLPFTYHV